MNGRPDWWEAQNELDREKAERIEWQRKEREVQEMLKITTYKLSPAEFTKALKVATCRTSGLDVDRIVDRALRVADAIGVELTDKQLEAVRAHVVDEEKTSSHGLDSQYEKDLIVHSVLAQLANEERVKVTPFVREYTTEVVRKVKTLKKGGLG